MPTTIEDFLLTRPPTADRPLLGVIVLVVEDSRFACDALRLICQRSGARIRRAESLCSAVKHLRSYRPRVALIDLGLPDGSGLSLISELARHEPRIEAIIATSGDDTQCEAAMEAGADIFLPKPITSISAFQSTVLGLLPAATRPQRLAIPDNDRVEPDPIALKDDLSLAMDLLSGEPGGETMRYVAAFLKSLARTAGDPSMTALGAAAEALNDPATGRTATRKLAAMIEARIGTLSAA